MSRRRPRCFEYTTKDGIVTRVHGDPKMLDDPKSLAALDAMARAAVRHWRRLKRLSEG